jgi:hypothetical protein
MESADRSATPYEQAGDCVRLVGLRNQAQILKELNLNPENPEQLIIISDRMADLLSRNCPVLSTLRLDDFERELRWSDEYTVRNTVDKGFRYESPKDPPADAPGESVSEPPVVWRITGVVAGRPGRGSLRLRLPDGNVRNLEFPASVRRRVNIAEGQTVTVVCNRQWRKSRNGGAIAFVVQSVQ